MKRLSGSDQLFLSMETPDWHQHIAGMTVLDPTDRPEFGFETALARLEERLVFAPKFKWKLKNVPFGLDRPGLDEAGHDRRLTAEDVTHRHTDLLAAPAEERITVPVREADRHLGRTTPLTPKYTAERKMDPTF